MSDRNNPDYPQEDDPNREPPPEVGEDPGMVEREPIRKSAREQYATENDVPTEWNVEDEQPTDEPLETGPDIYTVPDPLPYHDLAGEAEQPLRGRSVSVEEGTVVNTDPDLVPADANLPEEVGPQPPGTTPEAPPRERVSWLLIIIAAVVFCVIVLALMLGGVFA